MTAVAGRQDALAKAIQGYSDATNAYAAQLAENQQKTQASVDGIAATTTQTAADVTAVAGRQDTLAKAIHGYSDTTNAQMTKLAENQQNIQGSIDLVASTTGQTARDIAAVGDTQLKSEQSAQAGRVETVNQLAEIAQNQQNWLERIDATQARIQALTDSIKLLDQQVGRFQGALETSIKETVTPLGVNAPQRQQFETRISQDMQAIVEAISQLRQAQTQLQEQMSQVQRNTLSQTETLKTTIEQIKQSPVAVKAGDATSPAVPVVVEVGK